MGGIQSDCRWAIQICIHRYEPCWLSHVPLTTIVLFTTTDCPTKTVIRLRYWGDAQLMVAEYKSSTPCSSTRYSIKHQSKISWGVGVPSAVWSSIIQPFLVNILKRPCKSKLRMTFFRGPARITVDHKSQGPRRMEIKIPDRRGPWPHGSIARASF